MADSREEKIIKSMLGESVELEPPQSRIEVLLYELKDAIEQGGGSSGGSGSAEPFFFVLEIKGLDPQSGEPIIEETSTTYNNLLSMIEDGRPIYCRMIVPLELAQGLNNEVESTSHLISASHGYDSNTQQHYYLARFEKMMFAATSPNGTLVSYASGGGGEPSVS